MTSTVPLATEYLDQSNRFRTAVARELVRTGGPQDHVLYGVWLQGHAAPIYIGQSANSRRRLWDLPIGESHHLANSFPPEIWGQVVVVHWRRVLAKSQPLEAALCTALRKQGLHDPLMGMKAVGLGLELMFQREFRPLFNGRKKAQDGSWREVKLDLSASQGAKVVPLLGPLFSTILAVWNSLCSEPLKPDATHTVADDGGIVFPAAMYRQLASAVPP